MKSGNPEDRGGVSKGTGPCLALAAEASSALHPVPAQGLWGQRPDPRERAARRAEPGTGTVGKQDSVLGNKYLNEIQHEGWKVKLRQVLRK